MQSTNEDKYDAQEPLLKRQLNRAQSKTGQATGINPSAPPLSQDAAAAVPSAPPLTQETAAAVPSAPPLSQASGSGTNLLEDSVIVNDANYNDGDHSDLSSDDDLDSLGFEEQNDNHRRKKNSSKQKGLGPKSSQTRKEDICRYYKRGTCRHGWNGAKGEGCQFEHPKMCFKYLKNGTHRIGGCTKKSKCLYYHPPLCKNSMAKRECANERCKFMHLKGTLKGPNEREIESNGNKATYGENAKSRFTSNYSHQRSTPQQSENKEPVNGRHGPAPKRNEAVSETARMNDNFGQVGPFLELQKQILSIQQQVQSLMVNPGLMHHQTNCRCGVPRGSRLME